MGGSAVKDSAPDGFLAEDSKAAWLGADGQAYLSCAQTLPSAGAPMCEIVVERVNPETTVSVSSPSPCGTPSSGATLSRQTVSSEVFWPQALLVVSPNGQHQFEGMYSVVADLTPNGLPVWRKGGNGRHSDKWLYSSAYGTWNFGGDKARREHFNCHSARIFCLQRHGGLMPHQMASWWRAQDQHFVEDSSISVIEQPEQPVSSNWSLEDDSSEEASASQRTGRRTTDWSELVLSLTEEVGASSLPSPTLSSQSGLTSMQDSIELSKEYSQRDGSVSTKSSSRKSKSPSKSSKPIRVQCYSRAEVTRGKSADDLNGALQDRNRQDRNLGL